MRDRVAEMLRKDTRVRGFRLGAWNEGGAGVTRGGVRVIPDDVVERVRDETDIVSIIGEFVKLKRVGNSFRGPCPFHHGKNPNFSVSMRGGYNCFVCGEAGDVFTFVQKHLGMDFVEAVKWVGAKAGVEVREVARRTDEADPREPLVGSERDGGRVLSQRSCGRATKGSGARLSRLARHLARRRRPVRARLRAARSQHVCARALAALGFDDARQLAAGLLMSTDERPEPRPRFRGRLMFPIYDVGGAHRRLRRTDPRRRRAEVSELGGLASLCQAKSAVRAATGRSKRSAKPTASSSSRGTSTRFG